MKLQVAVHILFAQLCFLCYQYGIHSAVIKTVSAGYSGALANHMQNLCVILISTLNAFFC